MNDKNFDSLKNLKAPDSWIENALNIPNIENTSIKPIFFIRYSRSIAAVACLVLVCTISLFVALNKGDSNVLVVNPNHNETQETHNASTENNSSADKNDSKKNDKKKHQSVFEIISDKINGTESTQSTNGTENTKNTENSEKPSESAKPTLEPTEAATPSVKPSEKPESTTPEQPKPTDYFEPTEFVPSTDGYDPNDPLLPGTPPVISDLTFSIVVDAKYLSSSEIIYCSIMNPNGYPVCYDVEVSLRRYGDNALASYTLSSSQIEVTGKYTCYFYTSFGNYLGDDYQYA